MAEHKNIMSITKQLAQLKNLSNINPDEQWSHATKYSILSEIAVQNRRRQAEGRSFNDGFRLFFANIASRTIPSLAKATAFILVLTIGSGFTMFAQASVPGEALWPIKRNIEEAELAFTLSPVKKTEIHIKHINTRLGEIDKILKDKDTNVSAEEQVKTEKAIKQAVSHLEKDVVAVDNSLKIVKEEKDPVQVVALVEKVTNVAKETASNLEQKVSTSQNTEIAKVLGDAKKVNEVVKDSAVSLAITIHEEVVNNAAKDLAISSSTPTTTALIAQGVSNAKEVKAVTEVVTKIISSELQALSAEVAIVKDKVESVDNKDISNLPKSVNIKEGEVNARAIESIDGLKKHPEVMEANLTAAKDLLEKGNLKDSLEKITQVKETYQQAETVIKRIEDAAANVNNTSTSTKPLITPTSTSTKPTSTTQIIKSSDGTTTPDSIAEPGIKEDEGIPEELAPKEFY